MPRILPVLFLTLALGVTFRLAPPRALLLAQARLDSPVAQADRDFARAVADSDPARFRTFIAEDATFYGSGGAPARGRDAVVAQWTPLVTAGRTTRLQWEPKSAELAGSGDLGYTQGEYVSTTTRADGGVTERRGYYVTVWRKNRNGQWQAVVDIGSQAAPGGGHP